jgi:release factor glutamine methyltransferase
MRIAEAFSFISAALKEAEIEASFLETELILMHGLKMERTQLHMSPEKEILPGEWKTVRSALERRLTGEPMAYILEYKDFYKQRFVVGPGVLIPRPETELLVEVAVEKGPFLKIADLGCGSGCIGLSLLGEFPQSRLWAWDISPEALKYSQQNAERLGLMDRIAYSIGDPRENTDENRYDLVVSNPPYIDAKDDRVEEDVRRYEPGLALFAEQNGLVFYKNWLPWAYKALQAGGWALFEFGDGQSDEIKKIARESGFKILEVKKDLAGKDRMIGAQKE